MQKGSLVCVGTGMTLGSHISPLSRSYIEQADVVFVLVADGTTELWIPVSYTHLTLPTNREV